MSAPAEHLLIRARAVGAAELRLRDHLAPVFGDRIRFVVDATMGAPQIAAGAEAQTIAMTPEWIARRGLVSFAESGWRCGDYCYYAARDHIAGLARAWLIESDVWLSFADPRRFFDPLAALPADFLAPQLTLRSDAGEGRWFWWWSTVAALGEGPVHGCLFPITRMTAAAIKHCATARADSLADAATRAAADGVKRWEKAVPFPVPNDEGFTATTLMRAGFDCRDLKMLVPEAFAKLAFSWDVPLTRTEAHGADLAGQVLHPVLEAAEARPKLALLKRRRPERFEQRRAEAIATIGAAEWAHWAGPEA